MPWSAVPWSEATHCYSPGAGDFAAPGALAWVVPHPAKPVSPAMITNRAVRMSLDMTLTSSGKPASDLLCLLEVRGIVCG